MWRLATGRVADALGWSAGASPTDTQWSQSHIRVPNWDHDAAATGFDDTAAAISVPRCPHSHWEADDGGRRRRTDSSSRDDERSSKDAEHRQRLVE